MGPPSFDNGTTKHIVILNNGSCAYPWICEHRWPVMANMVKFRNVVGQAPVSEWWDNTADQVIYNI